MLYLAAALLIMIGLAHSYLGEKYILIRLFKRDNLPKLLGDTWFTRNTLRFAWHVTTIAWFCIAATLISIQVQPDNPGKTILMATALSFLMTGAIALFFSKGKHLSWIVFFAVAALTGWVGYHL